MAAVRVHGRLYYGSLVDMVCSTCGVKPARYADMEEYQCGGCGGLVVVDMVTGHDGGDEDRGDAYPRDQGSVDLYVLDAIASTPGDHQAVTDWRRILRWWHAEDANVVPELAP